MGVLQGGVGGRHCTLCTDQQHQHGEIVRNNKCHTVMEFGSLKHNKIPVPFTSLLLGNTSFNMLTSYVMHLKHLKLWISSFSFLNHMIPLEVSNCNSHNHYLPGHNFYLQLTFILWCKINPILSVHYKFANYHPLCNVLLKNKNDYMSIQYFIKWLRHMHLNDALSSVTFTSLRSWCGSWLFGSLSLWTIQGCLRTCLAVSL